jgi:hypothetical protein
MSPEVRELNGDGASTAGGRAQQRRGESGREAGIPPSSELRHQVGESGREAGIPPVGARGCVAFGASTAGGSAQRRRGANGRGPGIPARRERSNSRC